MVLDLSLIYPEQGAVATGASGAPPGEHLPPGVAQGLPILCKKGITSKTFWSFVLLHIMFFTAYIQKFLLLTSLPESF
jgi:hypothetical protein